MELNTRSVLQSGNSRSKSKAMAKIVEEAEEEGEDGDEEAESFSSSCCCFFCATKQPDARLRRASLAAFFRELPHSEDDGDGSCGVAVGAVWRAAMDAPDDPELPSLGAIRCMSQIIGVEFLESATSLDGDKYW